MVKSDCSNVGIVYRVGESVIIQDAATQEEWVMTISTFILYGPVMGKHYLFVNGAAKAAEIDSWTGQQKMVIHKAMCATNYTDPSKSYAISEPTKSFESYLLFNN